MTRRAYLVYQPLSDDSTDPHVPRLPPWPPVATLILDSDGGFYSGGLGGPHHIHTYEAALHVRQHGGTLPDTFQWDDEVWAAVDVGMIAPTDSPRDVLQRVHAPPHHPAWPPSLLPPTDTAS